MTKQEIIDYVMTTPSNPNKAVLEGMLEDTSGTNVPTPTVEDAGKVLGVGDNGKYVLEKKGFTCTEEVAMLTEESVTTEQYDNIAYSELSYVELITAGTLRVTFNGVEYVCPRRSRENGGEYGASLNEETGEGDFSEYPFNIASFFSRGVVKNFLTTQTAGTYSIKIETVDESVETTECFEKAVRKVADPGFTCTTTGEATLLTEGSVVTSQGSPFAVGVIDYSQLITADKIRVTFNGTEYICEKHETSNMTFYGSVDKTTGTTPDITFSEYPFLIVSNKSPVEEGGVLMVNQIATAQTGTYQIKIEAYSEATTVETTECFAKAVAKLNALKIKAESITTNNGNKVAIFDKTWNDIRDAIKNGVPCYVVSDINYLCTADDVNTLNDAPQMFPVIQLSYPPTDTFAGKVYFLYTGIEGSSTEGTAQIARLTADSATDKLRFETNCSVEMEIG